jgi:cytochrome c
MLPMREIFLNRKDNTVRMIAARAMLVACLLVLLGSPQIHAQEGGFTPLFNGTDFTGWEGNFDIFRIEDETIVAGSLDGPIPQNEFLATTQEYENFELRFDAKLVATTYEGEYSNQGNAGIQIRSLRIPNHNEVGGYQVDMGIEPTRNIWGSLYDESRRRYMLQLVDQNLVASTYKDEDWNEFVIRCEGPRIQVWLNGKQTVDYTETDPSIPRSGVIAPQIHGGRPAIASYRNIRIKEFAASNTPSPAAIAQSSDVQRPRDPFIFRINLDGRARMLVTGLHEGLWAAYDTQRGGLYRLWDAGVRFRGPVYDTVHAVQPESLGEAYILNEIADSPWRIRRNGEETTVKAKYLGYTVKNNVATIRFALPLNNNESILVEETPEYITNDEGMHGFERSIRTSNVPEGAQVILDVHHDRVSISPMISSSGPYAITDGERIEEGAYRISGDLYLNWNGTTWIRSFFNPLPDSGAEADAESSVAADADVKPVDIITHGKTLLGANDCAACHTMVTKQIGPSFVEVALKYDDSQEMRDQIAAKIRTGGQGVWGTRPMAAHPFLKADDAQAIAAFILSLDSGDQAQPQPGVAVDYYQMGVPLARMPQVAPGQNPNLSKAYPILDFLSGNPDIDEDNDEVFDNFHTDFVMKASGFLNIDEEKEYEFRFTANNGGSLEIDGEEHAKGHYFEGTYQKEFRLALSEGAHPFNIEFYHHLFDKILRLEWRFEGQEDWEVVPESVYTHSPYAIKPSSPGLKEMVLASSPGFGSYLEAPHPSYTVSPVRPPGFEPRIGGLDVTEDGRILISTWDGEAYLLENSMTGDTEQPKVTKIAHGFSEPLGIVEAEGDIYVLQRWELTRLVDNDGDGITDEYQVVANDWGATADFHEWSFGLEYRDNYFYAALGIGQGQFRDEQSPDRGQVIKIAMDGTHTFMAGGLREPNGIGFGPNGELFSTDNEGEWLPTNKFVHVKKDEYSFFGHRGEWRGDVSHHTDTPPTLWLPLTEISNSPTQPVPLHHGPYEGQMIFGDLTHGGIKRVFLERVDGELQGVVFRFAQGLEVGILRMDWGPDDALYAAGLGSVQDFAHKGHQYGLERLTYNGTPTFEMLAVRAKANGMEIEFTEPLRLGDGEFPDDYLVQQFWYKPSGEYGGGKQDLENLTINSVNVSKNRRKVFLEMTDMKPGHVLYLNLAAPMLSESGLQLWSNEAWYTLNAIPKKKGKSKRSQVARQDNAISKAIKSAGWSLLFDGKTTNGWRGYTDAPPPSNWSVRDGFLTGTAGAPLMTASQFDNFELEFDWIVEPGADSGVFYHVHSSGETPGATGPEMQLVDDRNHPDAKGVMIHASGSAYDVLPPTFGLAKASGEQNHGRIVVDSGLVEHWVNGIRVVNYDMLGPLWKSKVNASLFAGEASFAQSGKGHIVLQSRDASVAFKNIRIRPLAARERAVAKTRIAAPLKAPEPRDLAPVADLQATLLSDSATWHSRDNAVRDLTRSADGLRALIALAKKGEFPGAMEEVAKVAIAAYADDTLRDESASQFPLPHMKDGASIPSLAELSTLQGNAARGEEVFTINCQQCHVVSGVGTDFGPDQSDVGNRLTRRQLYQAILDPSGDIAQEFTTHQLELADGRMLTGFIIAESHGKISLKIEGGIIEEIDARDILDRQKQALSAMPSDIYQIITTNELADLINYLGTLKEN